MGGLLTRRGAKKMRRPLVLGGANEVVRGETREGIQRHPGQTRGRTRQTPEQAEALGWLSDEYQSPTEIAREVGVERTKVNGRLRTLATKGLAERDEKGRVRRAAK